MSAYKDNERGTWFSKFCHKDWQGKKKWVTKRGFATKREAVQYERDFLMRKSGDMDMTFEEFIKVYREDRRPRIKESTASMKDILSTPSFYLTLERSGFGISRLRM